MAKPTAKDKRHFQRVAAIGCIICGKEAEIHHSRDGLGMAQRDHTKVIPLCPYCHRYGYISRHLKPADFKEQFGTDSELVEKTAKLLGDE